MEKVWRLIKANREIEVFEVDPRTKKIVRTKKIRLTSPMSEEEATRFMTSFHPRLRTRVPEAVHG